VQAVKIVILGIVAAIVYGILHDQVTARVCIEYFTIAHPPVFPTESPTLLALGWGVLATWWVGLPLGILLAVAARAGSRPTLAWRGLLRPTGWLLVAMALLALVSGILGYVLLRQGTIPMVGWYASLIPPSRHARFMADAWAHMASYAAGILGGLVLVVWTIRHRMSLSQ
jgi:hypothetical protein